MVTFHLFAILSLFFFYCFLCLQGQARAVEALVRAKMQHKEFIILCLEDCSDWSNATTRRVVMQVCTFNLLLRLFILFNLFSEITSSIWCQLF